MTANNYRSAYEYLDQYGDNGRAMTKAEHDRHVATRGRPVTDDGIRPHAARGAAVPEDGKHTGAGDRER